MIPADAGARIEHVLRAAAQAGELPEQAASLRAAGTWRPAPAGVGGGYGTYATSLPLAVASLARRDPAEIAALLAAGLGAVPWLNAARVTGGGYLTITVTSGHLAALPARIVAAGQAAVTSTAMAGVRVTAPALPDLSAAAGWQQAWQAQRDALVGRLARAAGADVLFIGEQRKLPSGPHRKGDSGSVRDAVTYHGADAVRYALARAAEPRPDAIRRQLVLPLDLDNPFAMVGYAHASAASVARWAADLGLASPGRTDGGDARLAADLRPAELALVDAMSWLPERVAAAARRARPAELAAFLEHVAAAWLECSQQCPALPFGGQRAPAEPAGAEAAARLVLASAARVALSAGLDLLEISPPTLV